MIDENTPAPGGTTPPESGNAARESASAAKHEIVVEDAAHAGTSEKVEPTAKPQAETPQNQTEESADSDDPDANGQPAKTKNRGVGKRIDELTKEKYDAQRERDHWREMALKGLKPEQHPQPVQAASQKETGEPTLESCDFDVGEFNRRWYTWQRNQERQQEQAAERQRKFTESVTAFRAEHPDYDAVAMNPDLPITPAMAEVIAETDSPPALAYYLGQNPSEAAAIAQMDERAMSRAIGRIEARLSAPPAQSASPRQPETKPVPRPFEPVTTLSGAPAVSKSYEDMSQREYEDARRRERQARGIR